MIRFLGVIFICVLFEVPFLVADALVGNGFLDEFFGGHSVTLMGTLLGLDFVVVVFLMQATTGIEIRIGRTVFATTRREIKYNTYIMLIVFLVHLLVLILVPEAGGKEGSIWEWSAWVCKAVNLLLFGLCLYCICEVVRAAFSLSEFCTGKEGKDEKGQGDGVQSG